MDSSGLSGRQALEPEVQDVTASVCQNEGDMTDSVAHVAETLR